MDGTFENPKAYLARFRFLVFPSFQDNKVTAARTLDTPLSLHPDQASLLVALGMRHYVAHLAVHYLAERLNLHRNVFSTDLARHHVNELLLELSKSLLVADHWSLKKGSNLLRRHFTPNDVQGLLLLECEHCDLVKLLEVSLH